MRSKKLLSLILVLCMVMQILPVFAAETEATETAVTSNIRYIINDNFDDGSLGNWVEGTSTAKTNKITDAPVAVEAEGAVGKALFFEQKTETGFATGSQAIIRNDLNGEKLTFNAGKKIVLKARIRHDVPNANGYSDVRLQANRPNDISKLVLSDHEITVKPYTILRMKQGTVEAVMYDNRSGSSKTLITEAMAKNWVEVEVVFDGSTYTRNVTLADTTTKSITSNDGYKVSAKTATSEGDSYNGFLSDGNYSVYEAAGYDTTAESFNGFETLDSISFMLGQNENEFYIDYIQLYEITTVDATAALASNAVKTDGSIDVALTSDANITEVPANAATVKDAAGNTVKVKQSYNAATKTISLKPDTALAENAVYKVNLNTEALAESGINVTNAAEMLVVATNSGKSPIKYHIYDTFNDGSVGEWTEVKSTNTSVTSSLAADTLDSGEKVLKLIRTGAVGQANENQTVVRREFAKIDFNDNSKVVIKGKVKHTAPTGDAYWQGYVGTDLKLNMPEKLTALNDVNSSATEWLCTKNAYSIFRMTGTKVQHPKIFDRTQGETVYETKTDGSGFATAVSNSWVDFEITFDGKEKSLPNSDGSAQTPATREAYTAKITVGDENAVEYTGSMWHNGYNDIYTAAGYNYTDTVYGTEDFKGFTGLDSLSFMLKNGSNDLYIDELQLYEITADQITAEVEEAAQYDEAIEVTFSGADEIAVPLDAVTLTAEDGTAVEATTAYDATTKVFTITPAKKLTLGNKYKINIDGTKLATETAEYAGEASYTVTAKDRGGLIIDDDFNDGSLGRWKAGTIDQTITVSKTADPTLSIVDGAMKLEANSTSNTTLNNQLTLRNDFVEALQLGGDKKIVIKTRVKQSAPAGYYDGTTSGMWNTYANVEIKANRPEKVTVANETSHGKYTLLRINQSGATQNTDNSTYNWNSSYGNVSIPKNGSRGEINEMYATAPKTVLDKWVDVEIVFDGSGVNIGTADAPVYTVDGYKVTAQIEGEEKVTAPGTFWHGATSDVYTEEEKATGFTTLENLVFMLRHADNDLYVDYIQVKVVDTTEVSATVSDRADYNGSIDVEFDNAVADPSAAVTLTDADGNDVAVTKAYNTDTNTLTLSPSANLNVGKVYTVNVDAAKINVPEYEYTGEAAFEVLVRGENGLIINDTFDDGSKGNWKLGTSNYTNDTQSLTVDETIGALKFSTTAGSTAPAYSNGRHAIIRNDLDKELTFEEGKKIIVNTRIKHSEATDASDDMGYNGVHFKVNRPKDISALTMQEISKYPYTVLRLAQNGVNAMRAGDKGSEPKKFIENVTTMKDKWIDVTLVFDGEAEEKTLKISDEKSVTYSSREGYTIYFKTDDMEKPESYESSLFYSNTEPYSVAKLDPEADGFAGFTGLNSLSFMLGIYKNDLYVDYVEVYEVESYDGYAQMPAGNTVKYDEAIELKFTGAHPVLGIPDGVVTVKDAEGTPVTVKQSWDNENNILSITPAEGKFAKGTQYGVTISKNVLATVGMNYVGTTYFTVTARDDYETAEVVINDTFDNGKDDWEPGVALDEYKASVEAKDGYLHVTAPAAGFQTGKEGTVTKLLGNGIELKEGKKIVIETKIKNALNDGSFALQLNRPEDLNNILSKSGPHSKYLLMKTVNSNKQILVPAHRYTEYGGALDYVFAYGIGGTKYAEDDDEKVDDPATIDTYNKWIKYTITIGDEEIYNLHLKAEILDDDGNVTATYESTDVNRATIKTAFDAYERVFGKVPGYSTVDDYKEEGKQEVMDNMYSKWFSADRLTFGAGTFGKASDFYIDYIKVTQSDYERPIASVASAAVTESFAAGETVKPTYTLKGNTGTVFNVISAKYVDGKLAGTHFEKVTAPDTNEFTHTDATGWTVDASGDVVIKAFVWDNSFVPLCEAAEGDNIAKIQVYVDAENGSDTDGSTGAKNSPVKSLSKAFTLATAAYNADTAGVNKSTEIILASGTYSVAEGAIYVQNVSYPEGGLTIKAADGATPVIDGGYQFSLADAEQVTDSDILGRLPSGVDTTKIYALNLKTKMSSIPDVTYPGSYKLTNVLAEVAGKDPETFGIPTCEASVDGSLMTVARYPNTGYAYTGAISDLGVEYGTTITTSNYTDGFSFACSDANISRWGKADQALMFGYWGKDWATQTVPMASAENGTITSGHASIYKVLEGQRYYVYNLLEEIDTAGEYFIDRNTESDTYGTMFFYWPEGATKDSTISISSNNSILMSLNSNNITVDGLTFANGRRYGVAFDKNSSNNVVKNCTIKNTAQAAAWVQGSNNTVTNCDIHDVNGGISLWGGDVISLTAANNKATYNTIKNYARLNKTYSDAIHLYNAGNIASHNEISDGEHLAIRFEGVNHTISYNNIHHVCQEVDDAGAIYAGRTWIDRGNKIINNYIHDIAPNGVEQAEGVAGIFLDDHYAGAYIEGNVFANITGHGVRGNAGREHTIKNNLFVECTKGGVSIKNATGQYTDYTDRMTEVTDFLADIEKAGKTELWNNAETGFPELYSIGGNMPYHAWGHTYLNNVTVKCAENLTAPSLTPNEIAGSFFGDQVLDYKTSVTGNFDTAYNKELTEGDAYTSVMGGNYAVTAAMAGITGFATIDFANMGK